jgi:predicted GTPase
MNETPKGERVHIALFGRRNVGKSSLINALTGQEVAIVSDVKGTTTDPVFKAMELLPLGPVMLIDTPGLDDEGALGELRVQRTRDVLNIADVAILVLEASGAEHDDDGSRGDAEMQSTNPLRASAPLRETNGGGLGPCEREIVALVRAKNIPLLAVFNKCDVARPSADELEQVRTGFVVPASAGLGQACVAVPNPSEGRTANGKRAKTVPVFEVSSTTGEGVEDLKLALAKAVPEEADKFQLVGDLLKPSDLVVLVTPIDKAAPKGRLILPQQQTIRDILEADAIAVVTKEFELRETLAALGRKPRLVVTDSQVFAKVSADTPRDVPLTSFSILFARYKGDLAELVRGARAAETLKDGDRVLVAEGCTHHRQSDDIGTVKIPRWLRQYTGRRLVFEHASGMKYPRDLTQYALIVHCGACMLNRREMHYRIHQAKAAGVPVVNYGVLIAALQGILERCLEPFGEVH